ncbi:uroplakin-3b [Hoplias malabaricus]|uniref:uroplakin-3b n=1 Tax=Hoplias malabaricus TaxID=27720 RepID=UPI0034627BEA
MEACVYVCFIFLLPVGIHSQSTAVNCKTNVMPALAASITTNSVILQQPRCCFDNLTALTCTPDKCEIWLVPAEGPGVSNFDMDKTNPGFLSLSSYPSAFTDSSAKNYFLTKAGVQSDFPCSPAISSIGNYFRVGADGVCSTTNCNGILPQGSTARFKYLLVDPVSKTLLAETTWSDNITLYTAKEPGTINDAFAGRSTAMIVITSILSIAMALLLLFFIIVLALCCCRGKSNKRPPSVMSSFRIPHYDTHSLKDPSPYDNPAYEREKRYTTADTLPKSSPTTAVNPMSQDVIKMEKI